MLRVSGVDCVVFTLGNNAYGQCARRIVDNEEHRSVISRVCSLKTCLSHVPL